MLYILEGCDGTGKSTLAESLSHILDAEIIHCSSNTPNNFEFFMRIIEASKNRNIIADRFCYGQFVYQKDSGEFPLGSIRNLNRLEAELLIAGAKVIHVKAPIEEIEERLELRGEQLVNRLTVAEIVGRFEQLFREDSILSESIVCWWTGKEI